MIHKLKSFSNEHGEDYRHSNELDTSYPDTLSDQLGDDKVYLGQEHGLDYQGEGIINKNLSKSLISIRS